MIQKWQTWLQESITWDDIAVVKQPCIHPCNLLATQLRALKKSTFSFVFLFRTRTCGYDVDTENNKFDGFNYISLDDQHHANLWQLDTTWWSVCLIRQSVHFPNHQCLSCSYLTCTTYIRNTKKCRQIQSTIQLTDWFPPVLPIKLVVKYINIQGKIAFPMVQTEGVVKFPARWNDTNRNRASRRLPTLPA